MKRIIIVYLILFQTGMCLQAQNKIPFTFSILNEATSIPFTQFYTTPVHPGIEAGPEFRLNHSNKHYVYVSVNLGYIWHKNLFQGIYIQPRLGYDFCFNWGLTLKSSFGVGYLHTFTTQQEFVLKNGEYKPGPDKGNSRLMPSLGIGVGFRPKPLNNTSPEIFMMYQSWIEYPYSPGFIPLMSHTSLQLGTRFYISTHSNK